MVWLNHDQVRKVAVNGLQNVINKIQLLFLIKRQCLLINIPHEKSCILNIKILTYIADGQGALAVVNRSSIW